MRWLVAIVLAVVAPSIAGAKPMASTLAAIVDQSPTIAIVRYTRPAQPFEATEYELLVERPLRGHAKPGAVLRVAPSPSGHASFAEGTRLVAFVDQSAQWIAAATLAEHTGATLETGVLHVAGFFDFNAFLVAPGTVTLAQLEANVARGTPIAWTFRGPILVGSATGMVASKLVVTASLGGGKSAVSGIVAKGFPAPTVDVGSGMGEDAYVTWQRTLGRPLALEGVATGVNGDGSIAVEWRTTYPELVAEPELVAYLADARKGHPYFELVLHRATGGDLPIVLGKEIGRIGTVGGIEIGGLSTAPTRTITVGKDTIVLGAARAGFVARSHEALVEELMTGPIACTYAGAACTLAYVRTRFAAP